MKIFLALFIFVILLFSAACSGSEDFSRQTPIINQMPQTSKPLPPATKESANLGWTLANGRRQKLDDFKGQAIILDFWATYCPPCVEGIPHLVELQNQYQSQGLHVIGLHVGGAEDKKNVPNFVERFKMQYKLGTPDDELMLFYLGNDDRIPQTLVFDREGRLVQKFVGFDSQIKAELDKAVEQALKTE